MLWNLTAAPLAETQDCKRPCDGRFVLHRHSDNDGLHLDLRLELEGYLMGWRIQSNELLGEHWATLKTPHAMRWLDCDCDLTRVDSGAYSWLVQTSNRRVLVLHGEHATTRIDARANEWATPRVLGEIAGLSRECDVSSSDLKQLLADGVVSRKRAIERLCALGRELDGFAFDDMAWRKLLCKLSLNEINGHLRAYEARFDAKYPPTPVSQPEPLDEEVANPRRELAIAILKD
jgi:hypothetical protein